METQNYSEEMQNNHGGTKHDHKGAKTYQNIPSIMTDIFSSNLQTMNLQKIVKTATKKETQRDYR